ncbi:MAG: FAD-dependent oxidoreductase [Verrucomicrobia bacterium]|nr:FAD-dependent oxidoreductase [Verrucomicrobiota bacterium]MBU4291705.1 FAD-dependent oxidoreductase [Verrucomicrobiota bacterium]MBU4429858.1 FAD-dependent oxidoreductase [Verrucomicrobiota bacterium]MCG2681298.1 FAD-dependent oxidoreductase [Kiritimatiellia bacterium]
MIKKHDHLNTEVLVVGAGASGIPAAIAAARAGAKVVLLEEDPYVGGAPADMWVTHLCGGPLTGIVHELETRLKKNCLKRRHRIGPHGRFFLPEAFMREEVQMLAEAGVIVLTGARVVDVLMSQAGYRPRLKGVCVATHRKPLTIRTQMTVDATGTGAVAIMAGCRAMYGQESKRDFRETSALPTRSPTVQDCTWMYISQQLREGPCFDMMKLEWVKLGVLVNGLGWFHNDPEKARELNPRIFLHWGCRVKCDDTRDPLAVARAQMTALKLMEHDHALLRENGYAVYLAPHIGVRESNRIVGEHIITESDLRSGVLPPDTIALGTYGLDIWGRNDLPAGSSHVPAYGIPYRALVPKDADGLLLAGKAISGTHIAMSAYRVMPIAGSIGQAAGVAAALCAKRKQQPRQTDPKDIQQVLRRKDQHLQLNLGL